MTLRGKVQSDLFYKKDDRSDLKFYRPISLPNVDVKIITETLALRLGKILPSVISKDQTGIPGRNIATNLHTLNNIVKCANSKNAEAVILFLDQEKAFDRVDHQFLLKTLKHLKCICIEVFDNFFIGQYERRLKTKKKAFYRLLISVSVPEI